MDTTMRTQADDNAIAFRIYELLQSGIRTEAGDYIMVTLPSTDDMRLHGESCQPTTERVEERHIALAQRMQDTPIADWQKAGLA